MVIYFLFFSAGPILQPETWKLQWHIIKRYNQCVNPGRVQPYHCSVGGRHSLLKSSCEFDGICSSTSPMGLAVKQPQKINKDSLLVL